MKPLLPIHEAIVKHQHDRLQDLLAAGADTQALTANGRTPFALAVFVQNLRAMTLLAGSSALLEADEAIWLSAIRRGDYGLVDVPPARLTVNLCDELLQAHTGCFYQLPHDYQHIDNLLERCRLRPSLIALLPQTIREQESFYFPLLAKTGIEHWPRPWPDALIDAALAAEPRNFRALEDSEKTLARCRAYLTTKSSHLSHVPLNLRDAELCKLALQYSYNLEAVPESVLDDEMIVQALMNLQQAVDSWKANPATRFSAPALHSDALARLPRHLRSYQICLDCVSQNPMALCHVPDEHKTLALCCAALEGRTLISFQLNELLDLMPETLREKVRTTALFHRHIQPGEVDFLRSR